MIIKKRKIVLFILIVFAFVAKPLLAGPTGTHGDGFYGGQVDYSRVSGYYTGEGGGIYSKNSTVTISNSTFYGNSARNAGGGVFNDSVNNFAMMNSILWANVDASGSTQTSQVNSGVINHTCVQGWTGTYGGAGNINADPCFANPGNWADADDPNIAVEPNDPNVIWIEGDYHLKSQAGRWDPNSQSWIQDDVTSPCIDASDPNSPIGHEPFPNGGIINMGAHGGTSEASKSP